MKANPYLNFKGECKEAFELYAQVLGGEIIMMTTHGETPMAEYVPADWQDAIMHAHLVAGDVVLLGSDAPPDRYERPQGLWVSLHMEAPEDADRIYNALSENGNIHMPIQETFWAARFAMFIDRFGIPWMINCDKAA